MKEFGIFNALGSAVLVAAALIGCSRTDPHDILFTVGGRSYTRPMLERDVELRITLNQRRRPLKDEKKIEQARRSIRSQVIRGRIPEMLLLSEAEKAGIGPSEVLVGLARERYAAAYAGKDGDFESLHGSFSQEDAQALDLRMADEVLAETYISTCFSNEVAVTDEMIDTTLAAMRKGDEKAAATNAQIYATATNVWRRAASGEDFAQLADRYNEEDGANPDGLIGEDCDYNDFKGEDISVWNVVSALQPGEVTPPMDTTEGLSIFKCLGRRQNPNASGGISYHLARISFHRAILYDEDSYSRDYVRRELRRDLRGKVIAKVVERAKKSAKIEFPNGEKDLPKGIMKAWGAVPVANSDKKKEKRK